MTTLVLTVIGDDRAGLVKALADVIADGGGNWERSHLSELAGKFAGIVVVTVPDDRADTLRESLAPLDGLLDVTVHDGAGAAAASGAAAPRQVRLDILGDDRPGLVGSVSGILAKHDLSVADLASTTRDAPMAGGRLFDATVHVSVPEGADLAAVQTDLEALAHEIMVDVSLTHDSVTDDQGVTA